MSGWTAKRFWKSAEAVERDGGWGVALDGRVLRTPAKAVLVVPTRALADQIAAEWDAQEGTVDPFSMPFTRSANAAIDKVTPQFEEVAALIAAFGETDLCCYRAEGPEVLIRQQAEAWDPVLDWANAALGARLATTSGVVPVAQPRDSLEALAARMQAMDSFALTALHDLVSLTGSLVLGLAATEGAFDIEEIWRRSRIDETFQESQWGTDDEAAQLAEHKRQAFLHAARFFALSRATA